MISYLYYNTYAYAVSFVFVVIAHLFHRLIKLGRQDFLAIYFQIYT